MRLYLVTGFLGAVLPLLYLAARDVREKIEKAIETRQEEVKKWDGE